MAAATTMVTPLLEEQEEAPMVIPSTAAVPEEVDPILPPQWAVREGLAVPASVVMATVEVTSAEAATVEETSAEEVTVKVVSVVIMVVTVTEDADNSPSTWGQINYSEITRVTHDSIVLW